MTMTYVFRVNSSRTAVKSYVSISRARNSSRIARVQEYLNALMSSEVRSYRFGSSSAVTGVPAESGLEWEEELEDVAITRKVVRSKRMTSVALHAAATVERCLERIAALGIRV